MAARHGRLVAPETESVACTLACTLGSGVLEGCQQGGSGQAAVELLSCMDHVIPRQHTAQKAPEGRAW